jgi:hypothetical protein
MSELELIQQTVARTARRRRWQNSWRGLWLGLLLGATFWLLSLALYKLLPLPAAILSIAGLIALWMAPVGFLFGWLRPVSHGETARWIDAQGHYQERLSTALEVAQDGRAGHWSGLLLADAAEHARQFNPRLSLPYRLPNTTRWTVLILVLGVGLGFVPEYRSQRYQEKQLEAAVMQDTGRRLDELVRRETEQRPPLLESTRQSLDAVQDLAAQLSKAKLTRTDALRELASVTERLREEARELGRNPALRRLDQAARNPEGQGARSASDLQRQIQSLQQQLGQQAGDPASMDRMKNELDRLQRSAAGLPEAGAPGADAARSELSQALADLARQAEEMGLSIPNLEGAIAALEAGQIDQVLRDLQVASFDLEQMARMVQALQDLQMQLAEVGKNLAEQLDKGQGFPALASLDEMMRQLADPNLSREELDRLLQEIREAVTPGNQYGQVGELLAAAARQLQQGDRNQAGDSLSKAAEELRRLMEQMGDSEALLAALEGLQIAQMSVGNCMGWGLCQSELAGFKPGGKPGRGVGTWADDDGWMGAIENTGLWDNSGIERPDFNPRGLSDRGEGQLSDALTPTRVRGQISPGGSMPSITLRGLSVRGESRLAYEEAVASAQTDAQSALSQERVPRAYEGVVRDYFDDLKDR